MAAVPAPVDLFLHYRRTVEALRILQRLGVGHAVFHTHPQGPFEAMNAVEFDEALRRMRAEVDRQAVLALVASSEAWLRLNFSRRVQKRKPRDAVTERFRVLKREHGKKVALDAILDGWNFADDPPRQIIGQYKQLLQHRHWLAHGRYWTDKSGIDPDPATVYFIIDRLFAELPGLMAPG